MFRKLWLLGICLLLMAGPVFAESASDPTLEDLNKRVSELEKQTKKDDNTFRAFWKDGPRFETADKNYTFAITGRIHNDWFFNRADEGIKKIVGPVNDGNEIRRAFLGVGGTVGGNLDFKTEYDFSNDGASKFKDVYMTFLKIPTLGNFRIGQFKEPMNFDELVSDNNITFIERSLTDTLAPSRGTGFMLFNTVQNSRITWAGGVFKKGDNFGNRTEGNSGGEYNYTFRLTGLPVYQDNGKQLVHLGFSYSHRLPNDNTVQFKSRPEVHIGPNYVDTGKIEHVHTLDIMNTELGAISGPISIQAEYVYASTSGPQHDINLTGGSASISYMMTGETKSYKNSEGVFGGVKPTRNFRDGKGGRGAWEVAARVSRLDFDSNPVKGGTLTDLTFGVNWYLNPNARIMFNYINAHLKDRGPSEGSDSFLARFQVAW